MYDTFAPMWIDLMKSLSQNAPGKIVVTGNPSNVEGITTFSSLPKYFLINQPCWSSDNSNNKPFE